jgi:hypothetical protein
MRARRAAGTARSRASESRVGGGSQAAWSTMESPSERIAREISIMQACGGPLSRADWIGKRPSGRVPRRRLSRAKLASLSSDPPDSS